MAFSPPSVSQPSAAGFDENGLGRAVAPDAVPAHDRPADMALLVAAFALSPGLRNEGSFDKREGLRPDLARVGLVDDFQFFAFVDGLRPDEVQRLFAAALDEDGRQGRRRLRRWTRWRAMGRRRPPAGPRTQRPTARFLGLTTQQRLLQGSPLRRRCAAARVSRMDERKLRTAAKSEEVGNGAASQPPSFAAGGASGTPSSSCGTTTSAASAGVTSG